MFFGKKNKKSLEQDLHDIYSHNHSVQDIII